MNNYTAESEKPTSEVMRDMTESARELFASGERVMRNMEELQDRADDATDWRTQFSRNPMLMLGVALIGGILLARLFTGRD
jgi:hypothetical protein